MRKTIVLLFGVALAVRILASTLQILQGIHPITSIPSLALWNDFYGFYGQQLASLAKGFVPYRDFGLSYPPLFLYSLYVPFLMGGLVGASLPIVLSDALSVPLVYLIVSSKSDRQPALVAALGYAFSPLMLLYVGYLWIGSQPVTLFILLSMYFVMREKPFHSSVSLGLAVLFQQEALFILPVQMAWQIRRYGRDAWKGVMIFLLVVLSVSLPFLLISARQYVTEISYGIVNVSLSPAGAQQSIGSMSSSLSNIGTSLLQLGTCPSTTATLLSPYSCVEYPNPLLTLWVNLATWVSGIAVVPLLLLLIPVLYVSRSNENIIELTASYSLVAFLVLFSFLVHTVLAYYFIPVYALLICAARTRLSLALVVIFETISLTVSVGPFLGLASIGAMVSVLAAIKR